MKQNLGPVVRNFVTCNLTVALAKELLSFQVHKCVIFLLKNESDFCDLISS